MTGLEYGLFDCDTHCYETRDSFTRYLPDKWRPYAIAPVRLHDGTERILAADRIAVFNSEQGLGFDLAYRPGSLKEMLRQMASGNPDETYQPEPMRPEYAALLLWGATPAELLDRLAAWRPPAGARAWLRPEQT